MASICYSLGILAFTILSCDASSLSIEVNGDFDVNQLKESRSIDIISLNISGTDWNQTILEYVNKYFPSLEELNLSGNSPDFWDDQTNTPVHFKNVRRFSGDFGRYNTFLGPRTNIFWAFDKLEEVTYFYVAFHIDQMWNQFLVKNKQLKRLIIPRTFLFPADPSTWLDLVGNLPNLIELSGTWYFPPNKGITVLLTEKNQLQKLTINIHIQTAVECDMLSELNHPEWIAVDEDQCKYQNAITFVRD